MESSSSNSKERELQQMQLEERQLHSNCMAWFKELKIHLETIHNNKFLVGRNKIPYVIEFRILLTFSEKMYHNLNKLQWQLERENLHSCDPKTCLDVLRTQFKEFFDLEEVKASDFKINASKRTSKIIQDANLKLIDQESLSTDGTTLDASLVTKGATLEPSLVTTGVALDDNLVAKESTNDSITSSEQVDESNSSENDVDAEKIIVDTVASNIEYAEIGPSYDRHSD
ncbi:hypothetical protein Tco_1007457 [Tanacetum coccineum]